MKRRTKIIIHIVATLVYLGTVLVVRTPEVKTVSSEIEYLDPLQRVVVMALNTAVVPRLHIAREDLPLFVRKYIVMSNIGTENFWKWEHYPRMLIREDDPPGEWEEVFKHLRSQAKSQHEEDGDWWLTCHLIAVLRTIVELQKDQRGNALLSVGKTGNDEELKILNNELSLAQGF